MSSSSGESKREIQKKYHIKKYADELDDYIFMTEEWITNWFAHIGAFFSRSDWNTHVALIIYPIKYYYNDNGAEMVKIDVRKNRDFREWYEYPLHKVAKLPDDPEERKKLKELFYDTFVEMQKTWTHENYDWSNRNCQHFMKVLFEKCCKKKLPKNIQNFVYYHDYYKFAEHAKK
ncbi:Oidioi.mRNA.OKI2018_I69.PAR.g8994.t1.cds [Oikopleura dioica]|uniref:palmitoyl-protein hydrolase n=1 Tax=Oikopleura dioica TaxID=34765 RepID=A0ABN7RN18_OIKDI|nr:Oidioi.mRNA.OKI2018_I69.PAR.g8994.t1.cds [Oikopleura dioica]